MRRVPKRLNHDPEAVRWVRQQAGLTQAWLAQQCQVSPSLISEIEGGTRNARPQLLDQLAQALKCPRTVLERREEED